MTIDDAQRLWKAQPVGLEMTAQRIEAISQESNAFSRAVLYRDIREWAATLVLFVAFFGAGLFPGAPRVWFISAAVIALFPGGYLVFARTRSSGRSGDLSNREFIEYTRSRYASQERLLSGIVTWYLAPLFISALVFIVGTVLHIPDFSWQLRLAVFAIQFSICLLSFVLVGWVNIRAARIRIRPKIRELDGILAEFADDRS